VIWFVLRGEGFAEGLLGNAVNARWDGLSPKCRITVDAHLLVHMVCLHEVSACTTVVQRRRRRDTWANGADQSSAMRMKRRSMAMKGVLDGANMRRR
jgi:hypothetical protein